MGTDKSGLNYQRGIALAFNTLPQYINPDMVERYVNAMREYERDTIAPIERRLKLLRKRLLRKKCPLTTLNDVESVSHTIIMHLRGIEQRRRLLLSIASSYNIKMKKRIQI